MNERKKKERMNERKIERKKKERKKERKKRKQASKKERKKERKKKKETSKIKRDHLLRLVKGEKKKVDVTEAGRQIATKISNTPFFQYRPRVPRITSNSTWPFVSETPYGDSMSVVQN